jgi:hypothetical protein
MCNNTVIDFNGEFGDYLQMGSTDKENTWMSVVRPITSCSKTNEGK